MLYYLENWCGVQTYSQSPCKTKSHQYKRKEKIHIDLIRKSILSSGLVKYQFFHSQKQISQTFSLFINIKNHQNRKLKILCLLINHAILSLWNNMKKKNHPGKLNEKANFISTKNSLALQHPHSFDYFLSMAWYIIKMVLK